VVSNLLPAMMQHERVWVVDGAMPLSPFRCLGLGWARPQSTMVVSGVTARSIPIDGPYRSARLTTIATVVSVLSAASAIALDIRPDKNLADVTATKPNDSTKSLEVELAPLASDMWGTQKRLEEKGFRVNRGNKSATGWWLTANNRNTGRSIKVQSDGTKLGVTAEE
jgi:hypothetical protein